MADRVNRLKQPTISQVAEAAGVSRSTVSRVFTRTESISAATIERVKRIAEEIGYVPNHAAQALSTGRHRNIAVIVPDVANPFFPPSLPRHKTKPIAMIIACFSAIPPRTLSGKTSSSIVSVVSSLVSFSSRRE